MGLTKPEIDLTMIIERMREYRKTELLGINEKPFLMASDEILLALGSTDIGKIVYQDLLTHYLRNNPYADKPGEKRDETCAERTNHEFYRLAWGVNGKYAQELLTPTREHLVPAILGIFSLAVTDPSLYYTRAYGGEAAEGKTLDDVSTEIVKHLHDFYEAMNIFASKENPCAIACKIIHDGAEATKMLPNGE